MIMKYVRCDKEYLKNLPADIFAQLVNLKEPIPGDLLSALLTNNDSFRKERGEVIGRDEELLKKIHEIRFQKRQMSITDVILYEAEEDIEFVKKYPQFKPLIDHIELKQVDDDGTRTIIDEIPIDEYLAEH